jgi:hypothetical protein
MDNILYKIVDKKYHIRIEYNKLIKELNEILNIILYLCNNVNYERIKNLFINLIENNDYYDDITEISEFDKSEYITIINQKINNINKYILNNNENIITQINNLIDKYNELVKYKEENKDIISETDFQYQNENIINKINNIKSILTNSDNQEETDIINFNITLIDKNSYIFAAYPTFKLFLFKNLHCVEELTEEQKKGNYEDINKLLTDNYNLLSKDVLVNIKNNNTMMIKNITDFLNIIIKKDEKNKDEGEDDEE